MADTLPSISSCRSDDRHVAMASKARTWSCQYLNLMALKDWRCQPPFHDTFTTRAALANGMGCRRTASRTLNTALFAPIPSARVTTTIAVNRGARTSDLRAYPRSCASASMVDFSARAVGVCGMTWRADSDAWRQTLKTS